MKNKTILTLINTVCHSNMAYNEFVLPLKEKNRFIICSVFEDELIPEVESYNSKGNVLKYVKSLKSQIFNAQFDIVHIHSCQTAIMFFIVALFTKPSLFKQTVMTVHSSFNVFNIRNRLILLPCFLFFKKIVCCSRSSYETFPGLYKFIAGKRLGFINNGVNIDRVDTAIFKGTLPKIVPNNQKVILSVAAYKKIKNHETLIKAFCNIKFRNTTLCLIGKGERLSKIKKMVQELGCNDNVVFIEHLDRDEVFRYMKMADIFVSTSMGEGLPISVLEAMACGAPVILSDISPHKIIVEHLKGISLIPLGNYKSFALAIDRLLNLSRVKMDRLGETCREKVENEFSLNSMLSAYEQIYDQLNL
ncbi:MAG: glycosyltransferase family 4 protein [Desulfobacteraceae bacterium]|nr:glycosyltransferase family 4 protein [Desulfobacteraceae bacterium]